MRLNGGKRFTVSLLKLWKSKGMGTRDIAAILGISRDTVKRLLKKPDYFPVDSSAYNWFIDLQGDMDEYIEALKSGEIAPQPR